MRDPETAFVGEIADSTGFFGDDFAERVVGVGPPGRAEIGEDFGAVGQVHERAARAGFFKVAVAKFEQARFLFAAFPTEGLKPPEGAFNLVLFAIVRCEQQRCARPAKFVQPAQSRAAVFATRNLHEPVEEKQGAAVGSVT